MEDKQRIILAMEYVSGGELFDYIATKKTLSETEARRTFRQVVAAVHYCHEVSPITLWIWKPRLTVIASVWLGGLFFGVLPLSFLFGHRGSGIVATDRACGNLSISLTCYVVFTERCDTSRSEAREHTAGWRQECQGGLRVDCCVACLLVGACLCVTVVCVCLFCLSAVAYSNVLRNHSQSGDRYLCEALMWLFAVLDYWLWTFQHVQSGRLSFYVLWQSVVCGTRNDPRYQVCWTRSWLLELGCSPLHTCLRYHAVWWPRSIICKQHNNCYWIEYDGRWQ